MAGAVADAEHGLHRVGIREWFEIGTGIGFFISFFGQPGELADQRREWESSKSLTSNEDGWEQALNSIFRR